MLPMLNRKKQLFIFFCTSLFILQLFSVTLTLASEIDSLIKRVGIETGETKLSTLLLLSKELSYCNSEKSISYAKQALHLSKTLGNEKAKANAHSNIGDAYYYAYLFDLAKKEYIKSMQIAQANDLQEAVANACNNIGIIHFINREFEPAMQYFAKAEKIYQSIGDEEGLGNAQNNIGNIYLESGKYEQANGYYQKVLAIKEQSGNENDYAKALNNIGNVFEKKGELSKALEYYKKAFSILQAHGKNKPSSEAAINIGIVYQNYGEYQESMNYFRQALDFAKKDDDSGTIAKCHNNIGLNFYHSGNYKEALSHYQKALAIQESINDQAGIASSMHNIATIFDVLNQFDKALLYYQKALQIKLTLDDNDGIANVYNSIGNTHANLDDYGKALDFYRKALDIKLAEGDKKGIAMLYQNIGALMEMQGNDSEAIKYYKKSLEIEQGLGNKEGIAHSLQNIGTLYKNAGDFKNAKQHYLEAQDIAVKNNYRKILMTNNKYLSEIAMLSDQYQAALDYYITYTSIKDTLFNEQSQRQISDIQTKYETEKQQQEIELQKKDLILKDSELQKRRLWIYTLLFSIIIIFTVLFLVYNRYLLKNKANKLLGEKNHRIETHRKEILDSIQYASKIQNALLPPTNFIEALVPNSFILNKPRDVVSGDFYWFTEKNNKLYVAAADCTGHGVPGAFMSMLGITYLNEAVNIYNIKQTGEILDNIRIQIISNLHQKNNFNEIKDGMDIALYSIDLTTQILQYSGAHNPLYIVRSKELIELKPDSMPIAIYFSMSSFGTKEIALEKGDMLYSFSDGYIDQFGGPKGKKFLKSRFKKLLIDIADLSPEDQKKALDSTIETWKDSYEQIDDILVIGIKIS